MATFYRAASFPELDDIRRTRQLRTLTGCCEGKHMAMTAADAARWGKALHGSENFAIIRINVNDAAGIEFFRWDHLDGIGPACFATIEELQGAKVDEVTYEP
jgi:hypothetical protein